MTKRIASLLVLTVALGCPSLAGAGSSTDAALGLGAFAVFNQLLRGETVLHDLLGGREPIRERVVVQQAAPSIVYAPPPPVVVYAPPPSTVVFAAPPRVVAAYPRRSFKATRDFDKHFCPRLRKAHHRSHHDLD